MLSIYFLVTISNFLTFHLVNHEEIENRFSQSHLRRGWHHQGWGSQSCLKRGKDMQDWGSRNGWDKYERKSEILSKKMYRKRAQLESLVQETSLDQRGLSSLMILFLNCCINIYTVQAANEIQFLVHLPFQSNERTPPCVSNLLHPSVSHW